LLGFFMPVISLVPALVPNYSSKRSLVNGVFKFIGAVRFALAL